MEISVLGLTKTAVRFGSLLYLKWHRLGLGKGVLMANPPTIGLCCFLQRGEQTEGAQLPGALERDFISPDLNPGHGPLFRATVLSSSLTGFQGGKSTYFLPRGLPYFPMSSWRLHLPSLLASPHTFLCREISVMINVFFKHAWEHS